MGWPLNKGDLKRYPHFDAAIPIAELTRIATDAGYVARHAFLPFLLYYKKWQPFRRPGTERKKKSRPIRYASRRDSAIFSYYRFLLSERYESALESLGIQASPIAYRKMPATSGRSGKCNIDFAAEAFTQIRVLRNCCAVTLDVSSFFESIDHARLRSVWCELLGVDELPPDHAAVFKAITQWAVVDRREAYERLGYIGSKPAEGASATKRYVVSWSNMPVQLCKPADFRRKICGDKGHYPSLIQKNERPYGIPQGAAISDLLANVYLLHFDARIDEYVRTRGGKYYRYSDDIFIVLPGGEPEGRDAVQYIDEQIAHFGSELKIKDSKTSIVAFTARADGLLDARRVDRPRSTGGLEYLGFRFDGRDVYIRDSTLSRLHRNITFAARRRAHTLVKRYSGKDLDFLRAAFDEQEFESRYGRVADFDHRLGRRKWTFRTYVKRCSEVFGDSDGTFFRQLRGHRTFIKRTVEVELRKALAGQEGKILPERADHA